MSIERVVEHVRENPGCTISDVGRALDLPDPAAARELVDAAAEAGRITVALGDGEGPISRYGPWRLHVKEVHGV